jgi:dTDP-4-amino-4,6-dideoxygalactose transaminase
MAGADEARSRLAKAGARRHGAPAEDVKRMRSRIPVYPSAASYARIGRLRAGWKEWFPFNAPPSSGTWTFSGRVALYHGLPSLNLPPGSTILVPSYHQGVEIDTLLAAGYRLRYYRVDQRLGLDFADLERRLDKDVSALHVIHYFGFAQPLEPIRRFCDAHGLKLIEDCALSLFARDGETWVGSVGDLALFSVYKTLPVPHGGFLVTREPLARNGLRRAPWRSTAAQTLDIVSMGLQTDPRGRQLEQWMGHVSHWFGRRIGIDRDETISSGGAGWDPRLLGYRASAWVRWLMQFMDREAVIARRRANYQQLAARLTGRVTLPFPDLPAGACPLFFPVLVPDKVRFQNDLNALDIQSVNLWDASHPSCPPDLAAEVFPWRRDCLELPIHQELSPAEVDRVADAVIETLARD